MGATGLFVIPGTHDRPLRHDHGADHGIRASRSPASSPEPEGLSHEMDVLIDAIHRRDRGLRDRAWAFDLDGDVVAVTRRARVLVFAEAFTAFFFGLVAGFAPSPFNAA